MPGSPQKESFFIWGIQKTMFSSLDHVKMTINTDVWVSVWKSCLQRILALPASSPESSSRHGWRADVLLSRPLGIPSGYPFCRQSLQPPTRPGCFRSLARGTCCPTWMSSYMLRRNLFCLPCQGTESGCFWQGLFIVWSPLLGIASSAAERRILEFLVPELCERVMCKIGVTEGRGWGVCVYGGVSSYYLSYRYILICI